MRIRKLFNDRVFYSKLLHMTVPIAFQSLMLAAVAASDAFMLGRVEQSYMAAVSLATQVQFVQNMIISSLVTAGSILGAQYWGKGDTDTMRTIFCMILRVAGMVAILFCAACEVIPGVLMSFFTNDAELSRIGIEYLRIAGWSYLLTGITQCYLAMMKVTDHVKTCAVISSTAVVLNILFNAVLIFGLLGFPALNSNGAALATLAARIIELSLAVVFSTRPGYLKPSFKGLFHRNRVLSRDYVRHALPLLGGSGLWGIGFTSYTAIIGHMGANAAAANSVAAVVRDLMCCLCDGIASGGGILIGNELGAGHLEKGRTYGDRLLILSVLTGLLAMVVVILCIPLAENYMVLKEEAAVYLRGMMVIQAVYMIARSMNTIIINGIFSAGGDTRFDVYSLAVCMWGIAIPLSALGAFVFHWPVLLVYVFTCIDEEGKIPWVIAHYKRYKWVKDLTREKAELEA